MTFKEKMLELLQSNGLFENQAKAILDDYLKDPMGAPMSGRMEEDISGYPDTVVSVTWMGVQKIALDWIDKNCPKHWARAMFV